MSEYEARINSLLDENRRLRAELEKTKQELQRAKIALSDVQLVVSLALKNFAYPVEEMPYYLKPAKDIMANE